MNVRYSIVDVYISRYLPKLACSLHVYILVWLMRAHGQEDNATGQLQFGSPNRNVAVRQHIHNLNFELLEQRREIVPRKS